jgi:hypothetical protein
VQHEVDAHVGVATTCLVPSGIRAHRRRRAPRHRAPPGAGGIQCRGPPV